MITRATHTRWPSDQEIVDLDCAGLGAASVVRSKLFTLDNRLLVRRIGRPGAVDAGGVAERLRQVFA